MSQLDQGWALLSHVSALPGGGVGFPEELLPQSSDRALCSSLGPICRGLVSPKASAPPAHLLASSGSSGPLGPLQGQLSTGPRGLAW